MPLTDQAWERLKNGKYLPATMTVEFDQDGNIHKVSDTSTHTLVEDISAGGSDSPQISEAKLRRACPYDPDILGEWPDEGDGYPMWSWEDWDQAQLAYILRVRFTRMLVRKLGLNPNLHPDALQFANRELDLISMNAKRHMWDEERTMREVRLIFPITIDKSIEAWAAEAKRLDPKVAAPDDYPYLLAEGDLLRRAKEAAKDTRGLTVVHTDEPLVLYTCLCGDEPVKKHSGRMITGATCGTSVMVKKGFRRGMWATPMVWT